MKEMQDFSGLGENLNISEQNQNSQNTALPVKSAMDGTSNYHEDVVDKCNESELNDLAEDMVKSYLGVGVHNTWTSMDKSQQPQYNEAEIYRNSSERAEELSEQSSAEVESDDGREVNSPSSMTET